MRTFIDRPYSPPDLRAYEVEEAAGDPSSSRLRRGARRVLRDEPGSPWPPRDPLPFRAVNVQDRVLRWAGQAGRDLPWRRTRDPWAVMVSELMLQQTQVSRVVPKYEAFLARFPDPASCAAAPAAETVRLWAGLGYNRRALSLHRAARNVADRHAGRLPGTLAELLALPGVGPYTARAVLCFAFERDVGVLDSNAARVLSRSVTLRPIRQAEADELVPAGRGWAWNQAMLALGALVWRPQRRRDVCQRKGAGR